MECTIEDEFGLVGGGLPVHPFGEWRDGGETSIRLTKVGAALVETNHGIVNLILNEYDCYGKGHTTHSSGQIEWFKNSVDDRSVQVDGKQRICTIDGYAMPLTGRVGLMYLSIFGNPTDTDLERYPDVCLTGPHEWDPSDLDYTHPSGDGEPPWSNTNSQYFG